MTHANQSDDTLRPTVVGVPPATRMSARRAWGAVAILAMLGALATADRTLLSMLVHSIQRDFQMGDFQTGLLLGPAFAVTYVLCSLPIGAMVDRYSRRAIIFCGVIVWTLATLASGFAGSFVALFLFRVLVGGGEASISPSAHSLMGDMFPRERRTGPFSVYQAGQTVGGAFGLFAAGALLAWYSHRVGSGLFGNIRDWQFVFIVIGVPGCAMAFLALFLPEPRRTAAKQAPTGVKFLPFLKENARILTFAFLIFGLSVTVTFAQGAWAAEYLRRTFDWPTTRIGAVLGMTHLIPPLVSHFTSGFLADWLARRGREDATLRLYLIMALIGFPFATAMFLTGSSTMFIVCASAYALLIMPSVALGAATIQQFTPNALRGKMSALFLAFINLVGVAMGPTVAGALTEFGFKDRDSLGLSLAWISGLGLGTMIVLLWFALPAMRAAVNRSEGAAAGGGGSL